MRPLVSRSDELRSLLLHSKIATLDELKQALGTSVDVTVFRKLKPLDYLTSYSHRGRYYTLHKSPASTTKDCGRRQTYDSLRPARCWLLRRRSSIALPATISPMNCPVPCTSKYRTHCIN